MSTGLIAAMAVFVFISLASLIGNVIVTTLYILLLKDDDNRSHQKGASAFILDEAVAHLIQIFNYSGSPLPMKREEKYDAILYDIPGQIR